MSLNLLLLFLPKKAVHIIDESTLYFYTIYLLKIITFVISECTKQTYLLNIFYNY